MYKRQSFIDRVNVVEQSGCQYDGAHKLEETFLALVTPDLTFIF